jgi:hypothetical protein
MQTFWEACEPKYDFPQNQENDVEIYLPWHKTKKD